VGPVSVVIVEHWLLVQRDPVETLKLATHLPCRVWLHCEADGKCCQREPVEVTVSQFCEDYELAEPAVWRV